MSGSSGAGDALGCLNGERSEGLGGASFWLAALVFRDGEAGMLRLLDGLANGLEGRSGFEPIWLGRRTNGLVFSGERLLGLVGESVDGAFVGEVLGAGETVFWRLKGFCRTDCAFMSVSVGTY